MKPIIPFALISAFAAVSAHGAVTTPVGYTTVDLETGGFNLVGITLHQPTVISGTFSSADGTTITDADGDFSSLESDVVYILEITSGDGEGIIQEITNPPSATELATPEDISEFIDSSTSYSIREASTLNSVLGEDNDVANLKESTDGGSSQADRILVPQGDGTYATYFFVRIEDTLVGWFDGSELAGDTVLNYADGVFIQTRADSPATDFVVSGEVKTTSTSSILSPGFTLVNSVAPVGLTLDSSGLEEYVTASTDGGQSEADLVLIPSTENPGTYETYYYVDIPDTLTGWFDGSNVVEDVPLEGSFFIRNRGDGKQYKLNGPNIGSSL